MKRISLMVVLGASLLPISSWAQPKNVAKPIRVIGIVAGSPRNKQFTMRANGQTYRVTVLPKVSLAQVRGGDRVQVWGIPTRQNLQRANVRVLGTAVSGNPDDYNPAGR